jgi:hypothetical protein
MQRTAVVTLIGLLAAMPVSAQTDGAAEVAASLAGVQSSSEKVRERPAAQDMLVKTVVGQAVGVVDARAQPVERAGYNLLRYCWTTENVLGDWAERAGMTGDMVVRALETRAWQRDLARAGYPEAPVADMIGRYEAALVAAGFTEPARARAVEGLVTELEVLQRTTPGAARVVAVHRCDNQRRSLALNFATVPEDGRARFMPWVLNQICQAQQLAPDDPVRCDYWFHGATGKPISFAGETVYSVRWGDGTTASGQFDPEQSRSAGTVTLRLRLQKPAK